VGGLYTDAGLQVRSGRGVLGMGGVGDDEGFLVAKRGGGRDRCKRRSVLLGKGVNYRRAVGGMLVFQKLRIVGGGSGGVGNVDREARLRIAKCCRTGILRGWAWGTSSKEVGGRLRSIRKTAVKFGGVGTVRGTVEREFGSLRRGVCAVDLKRGGYVFDHGGQPNLRIEELVRRAALRLD